MTNFYYYLFGKAYYFCINIIREKEFPQIWAGSTLIFGILINILIIAELVEYLLLPTRINILSEYHKYFALIIWLIFIGFINRKNTYKKILQKFELIDYKKKRSFRILSIVYYIILFIGFFLMGGLLRQYNIDSN